jgi:hypothetical protein
LHMAYPNTFPFIPIRCHEWGTVILEPEARPPCPELIKGWNGWIATGWQPAKNPYNANKIHRLHG